MAFNLISRQLKSLFDAINENAVTCSTKLVPFHIRLVGEPGVGKSILIKHIAQALCASQELEPIVYYNASGVAFKDGLRPGTNVLVRDDGDMIEAESEIGLEIINLVSPIPMVQNMADLTKKGRYANYKFIITTGNTSHPTYTGIKGGAWLRRTHMLINVTRNRAEKDPFNCYRFRYYNTMDVNAGMTRSEDALDYNTMMKDMIINASEHFITEMELNNISEEIDFIPTQWLTADNRDLDILLEHQRILFDETRNKFKPKNSKAYFRHMEKHEKKVNHRNQ
jgi:hypothetical protein